MPLDPALIVADPLPLNRFTAFPFVVDEFPADTLFGQLGQLRLPEEPEQLEKSPLRYEAR